METPTQSGFFFARVSYAGWLPAHPTGPRSEAGIAESFSIIALAYSWRH